MAITWSQRQEEIFDLGLNGTTHIIVESRAGTAKTTTAVEMLRRKVEDHRFDRKHALVCAFNNRIRDELVDRVRTLYEESENRTAPLRIEVAGVHQVGFGLVRGAFRGITVDPDKGNRCASLAVTSAGIVTRSGRPDRQWVLRVNKLAQLSKYALTETTDHIAQLAESFTLADDAYPVGSLVDLAVNAMTLAVNDTTTCDFPDQIWLPARYGLSPIGLIF
jgi:superfamily I DNA/RNA helicase